MKPDKREVILSTALCLIPMLIGVLLYSRLPDRLPTHWDSNGQVNGYTSRFVTVFGMPLLFAAINLSVRFFTFSDPKRCNINKKVISLCLWGVPILSVVTICISYLHGMGYTQLPVTLIVQMMVGLIFAVIGNYLPKCKQNYTVGIKLPWTLYDEENWNSTHHMAGWLWMVGGLVMMANAWLRLMWLDVIVIGVMVIVPAVYSYGLYRKKMNQK